MPVIPHILNINFVIIDHRLSVSQLRSSVFESGEGADLPGMQGTRENENFANL